MKSILVASTTSEHDALRVQIASALAKHFEATLTVLMLNPVAGPPVPETIGPGFFPTQAMPPASSGATAPGPAGDDLQEAHEVRFAEGDKVRLLRIDDTQSGLEQEAVRLARTTDLFVTSLPSAEDGELTAIMRAVLADRTTAALALPASLEHKPPFKRVSIAWNGSAECARALQRAMPMVRAAETVDVIMIDQNRPAGSNPVEKTEVERYLASQGVEPSVLAVSSSDMKTADAILAEAERTQSDLLIAGSPEKTGLFNWWSSSVSKDLLRKISFPLLLSQ